MKPDGIATQAQKSSPCKAIKILPLSPKLTLCLHIFYDTCKAVLQQLENAWFEV